MRFAVSGLDAADGGGLSSSEGERLARYGHMFTTAQSQTEALTRTRSSAYAQTSPDASKPDLPILNAVAWCSCEGGDWEAPTSPIGTQRHQTASDVVQVGCYRRKGHCEVFVGAEQKC